MGGRIDRSAPLTFTVDGVSYSGFRGDTVASALLANGVTRVGRSAYRGRPRGIVDAGVAEPNALLQVGPEPMLPATTVELSDGLVAETLSGRGRLTEPNDDRYDKSHAHCDVLVVGAGPAGLAAALEAGRSGARVILADEQPEPGGSALSTPDRWAWLDATLAELAGLAETRVLSRATVFGYYDHNYLTIAQRRARGGRLWHVRAGPGGAGHRRARAAAGVRRQRPAGRHARGCGADLPQPVRGPARHARRGLHDQRQRVRHRARPARVRCGRAGGGRPGRVGRGRRRCARRAARSGSARSWSAPRATRR